VCVIGDQRPSAVAILVVNREGWLQLARDLAIDPADLDASYATDTLLSRISAQTSGLSQVWQVRAIFATTTPWTIEDGSLTPTLKVKRRVIEERFKEQIDALYGRIARQRQSGASRPKIDCLAP